ncbi:MAG: peptidase S10 [Acidimicrobiia bacterium]|nr:peptidase S10 [Acidimicrobiia bacterium]
MTEEAEAKGQDAAEETADKKDKSPETPPPPHHEEISTETSHSVTIDGVDVEYTATAGRLVLTEEEGKKKASFFFVSYTRDDVENLDDRPIVFAFNGGPGSSSVWLHLGALGPRRVLMDAEGMPYKPPGRLVDNEHSLLDAADLVFIDPVGTGFSRAIPNEEAKDFHHFKKDIEAVGEFIRLYLTRHKRWGSPKFLAGESYGTTRSAGLAGHLYNRHGIVFNGLLLISSILNFQTAAFDRNTGTFLRGNDLPYVVFLPTYAATAWYHGKLGAKDQGRDLREFLDEVEQFAANEYTLALFEGSAISPERFRRVAKKLSRYTGLSEAYVTRYDLRIEILRFCKELLRDEGKTVGRIDSRYTGIDRFRDGDAFESDPSMDATMGIYTSALNAYMHDELEYESDLPYEILSSETWQNWDYEDFKNAFVDVSETLRNTMTRNRHMKVFIANGYLDLATPYYATEYTFNHLGLDASLHDNVAMEYYDAGHMMYVHIPSLEKLAEDMRSFVRGSS